MKINPSVFKAYDIRGVYPEEIDEQVAYYIGRAFVEFLFKGKPLKIAIGRDCRLSSPSLFESLSRGIREQGADVINVGVVSTPMLYFSVIHFGVDGGIEITASHNPGEQNGFKVVREEAKPVSGNNGLAEIKKLVEKLGETKKKGRFYRRSIEDKYLESVWRLIDNKKINKLKIVVDAGNSVGSLIVLELFRRLKSQVFPLYFDFNGSFPHHLPNPLDAKNLVDIKKEIKRYQADLGIIFDGDADRVVFLTEKGVAVPGDLITALISSSLLEQNPGAKILYDIRSSRVVKEEIEKNGGVPIVSRVGHSFIKEKMREKKIIFGGELSGHYYFQSCDYTESPLTAVGKVLEVLSQEKKSLSQVIKPLQRYFSSGEINFKVENKKEVMKNIAENYKKGKISWLDGLIVEFPDWWFNLRPSNTENLLRLNIEAETDKLKKEKQEEITKAITDPSFL